MQLMSCLIKSYEERMFTPLLSELLDMHGKAAEAVSPSELPPSHTDCTLTLNSTFLPRWLPSKVNFFFLWHFLLNHHYDDVSSSL